MKIIQNSVAGTLESSDVLVQINKLESSGVSIEIHSTVSAHFHAAILETVENILNQNAVTGCEIIINDKGALDFVLSARIKTALLRASSNSSPIVKEAL